MCDHESRGGLWLAAIVAVAEMGAFWFSTREKVNITDELMHYKDDNRYLRAELERTRDSYFNTKEELHQTTLAFQDYIHEHPDEEPEEEEAEE